MSNAIWILRAPDGRVVGAGVRSAEGACIDALCHCGSTAETDIRELLTIMVLQDVPADRYEHAGYVLARGEVANG